MALFNTIADTALQTIDKIVRYQKAEHPPYTDPKGNHMVWDVASQSYMLDEATVIGKKKLKNPNYNTGVQRAQDADKPNYLTLIFIAVGLFLVGSLASR